MRSSRPCGAAFPEHAILGEESGDDEGAREGGGFKWIVDPIDGAANFAHGYPYYAVSIALTHGTEITHAVVLRSRARRAVHRDPRQGRAAQRCAHPRLRRARALDGALVGTVFPARAARRWRAYLPAAQRDSLTRCDGVRRAGACALDLASVAAGRLDAFWVMSLKPWDVAAGALLIKEAGGRVGDFAGGTDFLRTQRGDRSGARRVQCPARGAGGGADGIGAGPPRGVGRGSIATAMQVPSAIAAITTSNVRKPAALTTGPSAHTASELTPKATASRIPDTRERIRSST